MAVNLQKGRRAEAKRENLDHLVIDLTWGAVQRSFFGAAAQSIDCDVSAVVCRSSEKASIGDLIYLGHFNYVPGDIRQENHDLAGRNTDRDERILVDLLSLPKKYDKIIFVFNIFRRREYRQQFNTIRDPVIRVSNADTGRELCRFELSESHDTVTSMLFSELYRSGGEWKYHAIGAHDLVHSVL